MRRPHCCRFRREAGLTLDGALSRFDAPGGGARRQCRRRSVDCHRLSRRLRPPARLLYRPCLRGRAVEGSSARARRRRTLRPAADAARRASDRIPAVGFSLWLDRIEAAIAAGRAAMTITIALPSKGRMKDDASAIFERAGMKIVAVGNDRSYRGRVEGWDDVEIAFLSASEISRELGNGIDRFRRHRRRPCARGACGSRRARRILRPPRLRPCRRRRRRSGDLARRRHHGRPRRRRRRLPRPPWPPAGDRHQILAADAAVLLQQHGIQLYRIVESLGATEGAPASGSADIIVDITSTGSTLQGEPPEGA